MHNKLKSIGKEIIKQFAISFFFCAFLFLIGYFLFADEVTTYIKILNLITINEQEVASEPIGFDKVTKNLINYPYYGDKWGTLKIDVIDLELPIYHGDTLDLLKTGIGHFMGSYFPGEGGSILMAGHNTKPFFRRLPEAEVGSEIVIEAEYGTFTYKITKTAIIKDTETDKFPIQREEELLMIYTCYPVTAVGLTHKRYVVYAELVGESYAS